MTSTVLYVYRCQACGHRGDIHLADDSHDGEGDACAFCHANVVLEWDGGVELVVAPSPTGRVS